jgi:Ca2+-binding RTX toxin-like protein
MIAEDGNDTVIGGAGDDAIDGGNGNDVIDGQAGDDSVWAGAGDDVIFGDDGANSLTGNGGADRFTYRVLDGDRDTIKDFTVADNDVLDISALLADEGYSGDISSLISQGVVRVDALSDGSQVDVKDSGTGDWEEVVFLQGASAGDVLDNIDTGTDPGV